MAQPNFLILYVEDCAASQALYNTLLGQPPVDASPNFAMFALESGVMLGLWARHDVAPAPTPAGGSEIGFTQPDGGAVDALHADWAARGIVIAQAPTSMDFGYTFTALDPDGHRLRVFTPATARV